MDKLRELETQKARCRANGLSLQPELRSGAGLGYYGGAVRIFKICHKICHELPSTSCN